MRLCLGHPVEGYYTKDHGASASSSTRNDSSTTTPTPSPNLFDLARPSSTPTTLAPQQDPFGLQGDFITSPEISQVFGELLALFLVTEWVAQGRVGRVRIVELGPGRGTLLDDILRVSWTCSSPTVSPGRGQMVDHLAQIALGWVVYAAF